MFRELDSERTDDWVSHRFVHLQPWVRMAAERPRGTLAALGEIELPVHCLPSGRWEGWRGEIEEITACRTSSRCRDRMLTPPQFLDKDMINP